MQLNAFGNIFTKVIQLISSNNNEEISYVAHDLFSTLQTQKNETVIRSGCQSKIGSFFDLIKKQFGKSLHQIELKHFFETISNLFYNSVKGGRGYNFPDKNGLENILGHFTKNVPKSNEKFYNHLQELQKLSLKTISEYTAFIAVVMILFKIDESPIAETCINLLRKEVTFYSNNTTVTKQLLSIQIEKNFTLYGEVNNIETQIDNALELFEKSDSFLSLLKLCFITMYIYDINSPILSAKTEYIRWLNSCQYSAIERANNYYKYLWIRYRRLPFNGISPELMNYYTIDNVYVLPTIYDIHENIIKQPLINFFHPNNAIRQRVILTGNHGVGKTSLLHVIVSSCVTNSYYAKYKDGSHGSIPQFFLDSYASYSEFLGLNGYNIFPIVITGESFENFYNENIKLENPNLENPNINLLNFAYYIIKSYKKTINISGENNKNWYEKWLETFTIENFTQLLQSAIQDDRLLILIDGFNQVPPELTDKFENMYKEFINENGSHCETIITANTQNNLPKIFQTSNGYTFLKINELNSKQTSNIIKNLTFVFNKDQNIRGEQNKRLNYLIDNDLIRYEESNKIIKNLLQQLVSTASRTKNFILNNTKCKILLSNAKYVTKSTLKYLLGYEYDTTIYDQLDDIYLYMDILDKTPQLPYEDDILKQLKSNIFDIIVELNIKDKSLSPLYRKFLFLCEHHDYTNKNIMKILQNAKEMLFKWE